MTMHHRLPPLTELTPSKARMEFAKVRYFLADQNADDGLKMLATLSRRFVRAQYSGLLSDEDIPHRMWEAAETAGLVDVHGADTIENVLAGAIDSASENPVDDEKSRPLSATPYSWIDPARIPPREWLYGRLLIRKFVSATVAPGGVGKSSLIAAEALSVVSGKALLGVSSERLRVWLWNLEDPQDETARKLQAAAKHYKLTRDDVGDRLFVDSGRDQRLVVATSTKAGTMIARPVVDALVAEIQDRKIDILIIDPFVSCHEASENDNTAMDQIAKEWGRVADRCNCAVHLVHHTRKMSGTEGEVTTESARGGKSLTDACRVVRAVNRMTKEEGERAGIENHRLYFRTINDKANLAPPVDKSDWFKLESVALGNGPLGSDGDSVGVVTGWEWPNAFDGVTTGDLFAVQKAIAAGQWKQDAKAKDWAGIPVIETLGLDGASEADKTRVKSLIKTWLGTGAFRVVRRPDESRHERPFIEVGTWANT